MPSPVGRGSRTPTPPASGTGPVVSHKATDGRPFDAGITEAERSAVIPRKLPSSTIGCPLLGFSSGKSDNKASPQLASNNQYTPPQLPAIGAVAPNGSDPAPDNFDKISNAFIILKIAIAEAKQKGIDIDLKTLPSLEFYVQVAEKNHKKGSLTNERTAEFLKQYTSVGEFLTNLTKHSATKIDIPQIFDERVRNMFTLGFLKA